MKICLNNGTVLDNPEERIREYCDIEIYQGYDDFHNVTDEISWEDIRAADRLYANIMRFWSSAAEGMVESLKIPVVLRKIENIDLGDIRDSQWPDTKSRLRELLQTFLSIRGVGLAVATKVLHLKRPKLIPILDSYVMRFLSDVDTSQIPKTALLEYAIQAFEISRRDLARNRQNFDVLQNNLRDLPIPLEKVRMYDILCWTIEKWDLRKERTAPYGKPSRSLQSKISRPRKLSKASIEKKTAKLLERVQARKCKDAIREALLHFGGEGTIEQVKSYIKSKYGFKWKDIGTTMADLTFPGSRSSTYSLNERFLERVGRGRYRLRGKKQDARASRVLD